MNSFLTAHQQIKGHLVQRVTSVVYLFDSSSTTC